MKKYIALLFVLSSTAMAQFTHETCVVRNVRLTSWDKARTGVSKRPLNDYIQLAKIALTDKGYDLSKIDQRDSKEKVIDFSFEFKLDYDLSNFPQQQTRSSDSNERKKEQYDLDKAGMYDVLDSEATVLRLHMETFLDDYDIYPDPNRQNFMSKPIFINKGHSIKKKKDLSALKVMLNSIPNCKLGN